MHNLDWNDLRYILVVADQGSIAAAARALGVNHSTVLRRVNAFEDTHAVRLFDRLRTGYTLTEEGQQLLDAARAVEEVVTSLERKIKGKELKLEGTIRLTTTDSLFESFVAPHMASFLSHYPGISIELRITNHLLSLTKRDADVAIPASPQLPEPLIGEKVADINFALYAGVGYWQRNSHMAMCEQCWLGIDVILENTPPGRWMRENMANARVVLTADTFVALKDAAERGLGVALLPTFLGDRSDGLVRLGAPIEGCANNLWILTHRDLRRSIRIRTFTKFIAAALNGEPQSSSMSAGNVQPVLKGA